MSIIILICFLLLHPLIAVGDDETFQYSSSGFATMTHYDLPTDYITSCGCTAESTHYPTAALSQLAYGSSASYGPGCGRCFELTLLNTFLSDPPFYPSMSNSVVVKITDLCPGSTWCGARPGQPNAAGYYLNFDLAFPSKAIPSDFFPSDPGLYGYTDFGVWNISYQAVPCQKNWAGANNAAALGSVPSLGDGACCPMDPLIDPDAICPSFSLQNGIPPDTASTGGCAGDSLTISYTAIAFVSMLYFVMSFLARC